MNLMNMISSGLQTGIMNSLNDDLNHKKIDKLHAQLSNCTYQDEYYLIYLRAKYMIERAVKNVFHVYRFFDSEILSFVDKTGVERRFIEIKGILYIYSRGKVCKVDYNMMLPKDFPGAAPFVRIINRQNYVVDPFYQMTQSKTDLTSYVLNEKLYTIKSWDPTKSIVNIIIECVAMFRSVFPFYKQKSNDGDFGNNGCNGGFVQGQNSYGAQQQKPFQMPGYQTTNQSTYGSQGSFGFGQPMFSPQQNNGWNSVGTTNPITMTPNTNTMGMGIMGGMGFNNGSSNQNVVAAAQQYVGKSKIILDKLKAKHEIALVKIQLMDVIKYSIESEENYLRKENYYMERFLKDNEMQNNENLSSLVVPKDELSDQVLDLLAGLKAREETVRQLESKFNEKEIPLELFMKMFYKLYGQTFEERQLLIKCVTPRK